MRSPLRCRLGQPAFEGLTGKNVLFQGDSLTSLETWGWLFVETSVPPYKGLFRGCLSVFNNTATGSSQSEWSKRGRERARLPFQWPHLGTHTASILPHCIVRGKSIRLTQTEERGIGLHLLKQEGSRICGHFKTTTEAAHRKAEGRFWNDKLSNVPVNGLL